MTKTLERAYALQEQLVFWRQDIHKHPELGFEEFRTSNLVASTLGELGLRVETGIGKTGVVAYLGKGRPRIGIRADMDALPLQEMNEMPYASQTPGVMHACGHDAHVAMVLGAARLLRQSLDQTKGEIRFLFQPCEERWDEEGKSGAVRMIEDGALEGLDAIIALHVDSDAQVGTIGVRSGYVMAAVDPYSATILGTGCHSASPHRGVNPIFLSAQVINAIQSIPSLRIDPVNPVVISIESVHSSEAAGVIPQEVKITGNIRSFGEPVRQRLWDELEAALALTRAMGGDYRITIKSYCPVTSNDNAITDIVRRVAQETLGTDAIYVPELKMYGEDFSFITREIPGAMFWLGVNAEGQDRPLHSPFFDLEESALPVGTALLAETARQFLRSGGLTNKGLAIGNR